MIVHGKDSFARKQFSSSNLQFKISPRRVPRSKLVSIHTSGARGCIMSPLNHQDGEARVLDIEMRSVAAIEDYAPRTILD